MATLPTHNQHDHHLADTHLYTQGHKSHKHHQTLLTTHNHHTHTNNTKETAECTHHQTLTSNTQQNTTQLPTIQISNTHKTAQCHRIDNTKETDSTSTHHSTTTLSHTLHSPLIPPHTSLPTRYPTKQTHNCQTQTHTHLTQNSQQTHTQGAQQQLDS